MKFAEAVEKLKELTKDEYTAVRYELVTFKGGSTRTNCELYTNSNGWFSGATFDAAFLGLKQKKEEDPDVDA